MKKTLSFIFGSVLLFLLTVVLMGAGNNQSVPIGAGNPSTGGVTGTYTNSQVDTVTYSRESGVSNLAFHCYNSDSVIVLRCIVKRIINGTEMPVIAGDTIFGTSNVSWDTTTSASAFTSTITLAPIADAYRVYVTYGGSTMTSTAQTYLYKFSKVYSR